MGETAQALRRRKLAPQVSSCNVLHVYIDTIYMEHCLHLTINCPLLITEATLILSLKKTPWGYVFLIWETSSPLDTDHTWVGRDTAVTGQHHQTTENSQLRMYCTWQCHAWLNSTWLLIPTLQNLLAVQSCMTLIMSPCCCGLLQNKHDKHTVTRPLFSIRWPHRTHPYTCTCITRQM